MGRGGFHGRGAIPPNRDRFGRPLLRKLMSDPRFRTQMVQGGSSEQNMQLQQQLEMERMLSDPEVFLQQAEEQLRAGRLNPDVHRELKAELEKLSQFRKSQPQSPLVVGVSSFILGCQRRSSKGCMHVLNPREVFCSPLRVPGHSTFPLVSKQAC